MTFPEKITDREKYTLDRVLAGAFEATWTTLEYVINGKHVKLQVMEDALKIDGTRVNVLRRYNNSWLTPSTRRS